MQSTNKLYNITVWFGLIGFFILFLKVGLIGFVFHQIGKHIFFIYWVLDYKIERCWDYEH
jgi:hypothetical protein